MFGVASEGKFGDAFVGSLSFNRDIVSDTTASLRREIVKQEVLAGASFEPFFRLSLGGNYSIIDYSDNNWTTGYDLWSSYLLFTEPVFLKLFYKYEFKESDEGSVKQGTLLADFRSSNSTKIRKKR